MPLWSGGQSFWRHIQRSRFDSRSYKIIWEVVGLELGPLSLVSTIEELFKGKSCGSCLESREYGRRDPSRWPIGTLYQQKLALTSQTSSGSLVGIVHARTQATEIIFMLKQKTQHTSYRNSKWHITNNEYYAEKVKEREKKRKSKVISVAGLPSHVSVHIILMSKSYVCHNTIF
jgi:hypothetical protein